MIPEEISHDQITRFLNKSEFSSKELWLYIKPQVRQHEMDSGGVLILDDSIEEKPYTDENELVCWHHARMHNRHIKGINILSCMVGYGEMSLPIAYEIIRKDVSFCDVKSRKEQRKSSVTKNEHFREIVGQCIEKKVLFDYVLADNWFGSAKNMEYIHSNLQKLFIIGIKSTRTAAQSKKDKKLGQFQQISSLDMEDGQSKQVWLKGVNFPITLVKKVFKNEDGSTGILYLASNDLTDDADFLYETYQKRWKIEVYHKSIKQNTSLAKSPTKKVRSQANHIFASIISFCKLEALQIATSTNHFALKYKLIIKANIASMTELANLQKTAFTA